MTEHSTDSDKPGGDLTDHGADPTDREQHDPGTTTGHAHDGPEGEQTPAGDLTDHGVDAAKRAEDETGT